MEAALLAAALVGLVAFSRREGFTDTRVKKPDAKDADLVAKIRAAAPSANVEAYMSVLKAFYEDVYQPAQQSPTPQTVDAFLGTQDVLKPQDKTALRGILIDVFYVTSTPVEGKEAQQVKFTPDNSALQPNMAASEEYREMAPPAPYETADPNPIFPKSKVMPQLPPLGRGGEAAAYTWDQAAYQQDSAVSRPGIVEGFSTTSGAPITNEIYGPRIPKQGGMMSEAPKTKVDDSTRLPMLYGPDYRPKKPTNAPAPNAAGACAIQAGPGSNDLLSDGAVTAQQVVMELPNITKTEPVPFLGDFTKFFK